MPSIYPEETAPQLTPRCRAHSKRTGEPCNNFARTGYPVCSMHGAGRGDKHPGDANITHGRYSRFMKLSVQELVETFLEEEEPKNLDNEVATARAVVQKLLEQIEQPEDPIAYAAVVNALNKMLDTIGLLVTRRERLKDSEGIPRADVVRLVNEMQAVAGQVVKDPGELKELIAAWRGIRILKTGRK